MFMSNKQGNNVKLSVWALCCRSLRGTRLRSYGSQLSYTPMFNFCCFADRTNCILAEYYPFVNYFFVFLPIEREFFVIWELSAIVDYYKQA
ncbi:Uncharacterised protein [Flavonifractor plautii]|nr:Uncharacterised protein [Flavonifractor plautii]